MVYFIINEEHLVEIVRFKSNTMRNLLLVIVLMFSFFICSTVNGQTTYEFSNRYKKGFVRAAQYKYNTGEQGVTFRFTSSTNVVVLDRTVGFVIEAKKMDICFTEYNTLLFKEALQNAIYNSNNKISGVTFVSGVRISTNKGGYIFITDMESNLKTSLNKKKTTKLIYYLNTVTF